MARLGARCILATLFAYLILSDPSREIVLQGWHFFDRFTPFHVLWIIWVGGMVMQLFPLGRFTALGSHKVFERRFRPAGEGYSPRELKKHMAGVTLRAYLGVFLTWTALAAILFWGKARGLLRDADLFLISLSFFIFDLVCVLIWCPFRLLLGNRCCTTCRIFNWDHLMMFTPMLPVRGFYALSLIALAAAVWIAWELCALRHPERFWVRSNAALRCENCTDKLCIQYCEKSLFGGK